MAELSKNGLLVQNNQSFPNNNTGYITPELLRNFNIDVIDSTVNQIGYDATISSLTAFTASATASIQQLLNLSSSLSGGFVTQGELADATGSLIVSINTKLDTASFDSYSSSLNSLSAGTASVNSFTQSANSRLNNLESTSASVNVSVSNLNTFTSSLAPVVTSSLVVTAVYSGDTITYTKGDASTFTNIGIQNTASFNSYTSSTDSRLSNIEINSASVNSSISQLNTSSGSQQVSINELNAGTASVNTFTASANSRLNAIETVSGSWITESETGSFLRSGANTFSGSQTITGSVAGNVTALSITSNTASMNMSLGNLFTLTLSGSSVHLDATNISTGQTVNLLVTQNAAGTATLSLAPKFKQAAGFTYVASPSASAQDILTFATFNTTTSIYTLNAKQFV
jgi:hypothetical protein